MRVWDEPLDYTDDDELDEQPAYQPPPDALSMGVGGTWYATRYTLEECQQTYPGSALKAPAEWFDRYYVHSGVGALLVDILVGDGDQRDAQARRKHVAFKQRWCRENDRRYLVLTEDDAENPDRVRALLQGDQNAETSNAPSRSEAPQRKPTARQRGKVQRPKAAA
jgi:hypothetical protein